MGDQLPTMPALPIQTDASWPADVRIIMSSLEAADPGLEERRACTRQPYRVSALLALFSDLPGEPARLLYTRDVTTRSLGFLSRQRLPIGHGGHIELLNTRGRFVRIPCIIHRCREVVPGWYEGAVSFNREQFSFG